MAPSSAAQRGSLTFAWRCGWPASYLLPSWYKVWHSASRRVARGICI